MYFFLVMPIQREWHYIDRQADREAVDQMLPLLIGPTIAQVLTTMGKTRLHVTCIFTVTWSLNHPCCICS